MQKRLITFEDDMNAKLESLSELYDLPVTWIVRRAVTEFLQVYRKEDFAADILAKQNPTEA